MRNTRKRTTEINERVKKYTDFRNNERTLLTLPARNKVTFLSRNLSKFIESQSRSQIVSIDGKIFNNSTKLNALIDLAVTKGFKIANSKQNNTKTKA